MKPFKLFQTPCMWFVEYACELDFVARFGWATRWPLSPSPPLSRLLPMSLVLVSVTLRTFKSFKRKVDRQKRRIHNILGNKKIAVFCFLSCSSVPDWCYHCLLYRFVLFKFPLRIVFWIYNSFVAFVVIERFAIFHVAVFTLASHTHDHCCECNLIHSIQVSNIIRPFLYKQRMSYHLAKHAAQRK